MKTIVLWSGAEIVVDDEQAEKIKAGIGDEEDPIDHFEIGDYWFRASSVAEIKPGGTGAIAMADQLKIDDGRTPMSELSDEEREHRRAKIAEMKDKFLKRQEERKQKNDV